MIKLENQINYRIVYNLKLWWFVGLKPKYLRVKYVLTIIWYEYMIKYYYIF